MRVYLLFIAISATAQGFTYNPRLTASTSLKKTSPIVFKSLATHSKNNSHLIHYHTRGQSNLLSAAISGNNVVSDSNDNTTNILSSPFGSTALLITLDVVLRRLFQTYQIPFPSSLAGLGLLFTTLCFSGEGVAKYFEQGSTLLAKWLACFFVPSLVVLPLAESMGSGLELLKIGVVIVGGFLFTLLTTAWFVMAVKGTNTGVETRSGEEKLVSKANVSAGKPAPLFTNFVFRSFKVSTLATFIAVLFNKQFLSLHLLMTTMTSFIAGTRVPSKIMKLVHPLITCTALIWFDMLIISKIISGSSFIDLLRGYKVGSLSLGSWGAGDVLLFLLGPSVVSLGWQMFQRRKLIQHNLKEVTTATVVSTFGGIFGTAALVRCLNIAKESLRLSLISRNITSPLAMVIASLLGGANVSLAVSFVVITGLIGANFGSSILTRMGIKDPIARGLSIGAAAHGLGTAAFRDEKDAFPFAAIAMALTASASTFLVSIHAVRNFVLKLALGRP